MYLQITNLDIYKGTYAYYSGGIIMNIKLSNELVSNSNKGLGKVTLVAQFIVPGILIAIVYGILASPILNIRFPGIVILALAGVLVLVPIEVGILLYRSKKDYGEISLKKIVLYQNKLPIKTYLWVVPLTLVWVIVVMVAGKGLNEYIRLNFFSWLPEWYPMSTNYLDYETWKLVITFLCAFLLGGIVFPTIEEIYFRGYLLPRMEWMGRWAPLMNAFLFSLYHFWSPWQTVTRTIALLPICYITYKTKNIKVAIIVHCLLNIMGDAVGILFLIV